MKYSPYSLIKLFSSLLAVRILLYSSASRSVGSVRQSSGPIAVSTPAHPGSLAPGAPPLGRGGMGTARSQWPVVRAIL